MTEKEALKEAKKLGLNSIHEMRNGEFMPGSTHQQYESWINDPLKSVYSKLRTLEPTEFIQGSNQIEPTEKDYESGFFYRYFAQVINNPDAPILEITDKRFDEYDTYYRMTKVRWRLSGTPTEVETSNKSAVVFSSEKFPTLLRKKWNYTEFYKN